MVSFPRYVYNVRDSVEERRINGAVCAKQATPRRKDWLWWLHPKQPTAGGTDWLFEDKFGDRCEVGIPTLRRVGASALNAYEFSSRIGVATAEILASFFINLFIRCFVNC